MMKMRKVLALMLAGLMAVSTPVVAFAKGDGEAAQIAEENYSITPRGTPDGEAPILKSISIDKTIVAPGETVTLTVAAEDDVSGLRCIWLYFMNYETGVVKGYDYWFDEPLELYELTFALSEFEASGTWCLSQLELWDKAGNRRYYYPNSDEYEGVEHHLPNEISFTVSENADGDNTAPILKAVSFDKTTVSAGETINLIVDAEDDRSGISGIIIWYFNEEYGREFRQYYGVEDQTAPYELPIYINEYEPGGTIRLGYVDLRDRAENTCLYHCDDDNHGENLPNEASFTVSENEKGDGKAPDLLSVTMKKSEVDAPGFVTAVVDVEEEGSGMEMIRLQFINKENDRHVYDDIWVRKQTAPYELTFEVSQFEPSGFMELEYVELQDRAGNIHRYWLIEDDEVFLDADPLHCKATFFVHNSDEEADGDVVTSTEKENIAEKIEEMEEGKTAYIYYGNDATLNEEVFEAVAGTDKKVVLSSTGIQWEFDGQTVDPEKAKNLELDVQIKRDDYSDSENSEDITEALEGKNSIIVSFPENGELPGPAKIRIKMDYAFRDYINYRDGEATVYVYYYDNVAGEFVEVASNLAVGEDEYLEFTITHNSDFVIMNSRLENAKLPGDINEDGRVNSADVNWLYRMVMGYAEMQDELAKLDINKDGMVNSADVNRLYRYVMDC